MDRFVFQRPDGQGFWTRTGPFDGGNFPFRETGFHSREGAASVANTALTLLVERIKSGRLAPASVMVTEAYEQAEAVISIGRERGHIYDNPTLAELEAALPVPKPADPDADVQAGRGAKKN